MFNLLCQPKEANRNASVPSGVRGGAVSERLQPVRVGGRAVERVEGQQRGLKGELRRRRPDQESPVRPLRSYSDVSRTVLGLQEM